MATGEPVQGSSLVFARAQPLDERLDAFDCGPEWWAREITAELRDRPRWADRRDLFMFLRGEDLVAAARLGFWNRPHPHRDSDERERYYLILSFGVNNPYQGQKDPGSGPPPRSYAGLILDFMEEKARQREGCVGITLHVRDENAHAREVYEQRGFECDGESFMEDGRLTWEMRKRF